MPVVSGLSGLLQQNFSDLFSRHQILYFCDTMEIWSEIVNKSSISNPDVGYCIYAPSNTTFTSKKNVFQVSSQMYDPWDG